MDDFSPPLRFQSRVNHPYGLTKQWTRRRNSKEAVREIGVRQISLQITDAHLTQLDAKAAQAGVTRSVWLRALFDKIF
jgi:hypothetical protein